MSILVLQSSWWGRESWLLSLICLPGVSWWFSGSSSRCHRVVCSLWLWYFLIILTYYFGKKWPTHILDSTKHLPIHILPFDFCIHSLLSFTNKYCNLFQFLFLGWISDKKKYVYFYTGMSEYINDEKLASHLLFPRKRGLTIYLAALKMGIFGTLIRTVQYIGKYPYDLNRNKAMHNATLQLFAIGRITLLFPVRVGRRFGTSKMHISPQWLRLLSVLRRWFCCCLFVVDRFSHCGIQYLFNVLLWERSGSVVECLTRDRRAARLSLTGVTALCPWARTLILA